MEPERLSRRDIVSAAATILPFSAVRGSAANSAVTVGLIGCGARGYLDSEYLLQVDGARLVALADVFPERIERVRTRLKLTDAMAFNRDTELLEKSGVDAVIIATPGYLHPEHIEAALRAKKHVYIEKPAGADVAGVKRFMAAADAADRSLNVAMGFQQRYGAGYHKAKQQLDANLIGRVLAAHSYWVKNQVGGGRPQLPRPTAELDKIRQWHDWQDLLGDWIVENHVHGVDALNWFMGGHATKAYGTGGRTVLTHGDNNDHWYVTLDYGNNVQGHLIGCMFTNVGYRDVKEHYFGPSGVIETHREYWRHIRSANNVVTEKEPREITIDALDEFIRRIREGRPENAAVRGGESTLTTIMARMAVQLRREVTWEEMMKSG